VKGQAEHGQKVRKMWQSHHSCPLTETVIDETRVEWVDWILMIGGIARKSAGIESPHARVNFRTR
jgi:hypothetical protein